MLNVNTNAAKGRAIARINGKYCSERSQRPPKAAKNRLTVPKSGISVPPCRQCRKTAACFRPCQKPWSVAPGEPVRVLFPASCLGRWKVPAISSGVPKDDGRMLGIATVLRLRRLLTSPHPLDSRSRRELRYRPRRFPPALTRAPSAKHRKGREWQWSQPHGSSY